jgi:hypothetical protein
MSQFARDIIQGLKEAIRMAKEDNDEERRRKNSRADTRAPESDS